MPTDTASIGAAGGRRELVDSHGRRPRKLRVSVTDRCQMRCRYCMPDGPADGWLPRAEILDYEEIARFVEVSIGLGIEEVRITGGEPLVRRELSRLVAQLVGLDGLRKVAITTNGLRLAEELPELLDAGLDGITVSIDSLVPERFRRMTGGTELGPVRAAIDALAASEAAERKLNTVLIRGENHDEIEALIRFGAERGIEPRFIEFMPFGAHWGPGAVVPMGEILDRVAAAFGLPEPLDVARGSTSRRWALPALDGATFGVIPTMSETLCGACDRFRLTADGRLLNCLFDARGVDVKGPLRTGGAADVRRALARAVAAKGPGYLAERRDFVPLAHMHRVGG